MLGTENKIKNLLNERITTSKIYNLKMNFCKRKEILRLLTVLYGIICINVYCNALIVPGYIINEKSDTVYGTVQLSRFNQFTGGFMINGIDFETLHLKVIFRANDDSRFKSFSPEMISEFGFNYDSTDYVFKSFIIYYKSLFKVDRQRNRFLCLVYKGNIDLFEDLAIYNPLFKSSHDDYLTYRDYFLYNASRGLLKLEANDTIKNIKDILSQFDIDGRFLRQIPENMKLENIIPVLGLYDKWLSNKGH
jgi:hypothetical protein